MPIVVVLALLGGLLSMLGTLAWRGDRRATRSPRSPASVPAVTHAPARPECLLQVRVLDAFDHTPVLGARVSVPPNGRRARTESRTTSPEGTVAFLLSVDRGDVSSAVTVVVEAPGYTRAERSVNLRGRRRSLAVYLRGRGHLHGTVVDAAAGTPIPNATILAQPPDYPRPLRSMNEALTDRAGRFELPGLPPDGSAMLTVHALGYEKARLGPYFVAASTPCRIELVPSRPLWIAVSGNVAPYVDHLYAHYQLEGGGRGERSRLTWSETQGAAVTVIHLPPRCERAHVLVTGMVGEVVAQKRWRAADGEVIALGPITLQPYELVLVHSDADLAGQWLRWSAPHGGGGFRASAKGTCLLFVPITKGFHVDLHYRDASARGVHVPDDRTARFTPEVTGVLHITDASSVSGTVTVWRVGGDPGKPAARFEAPSGDRRLRLPAGWYRIDIDDGVWVERVAVYGGATTRFSLDQPLGAVLVSVRGPGGGEGRVHVRMQTLLQQGWVTVRRQYLDVPGALRWDRIGAGTFLVEASHPAWGTVESTVRRTTDLGDSELVLDDWSPAERILWKLLDARGSPVVHTALQLERLPPGRGKELRLATDDRGEATLVGGEVGAGYGVVAEGHAWLIRSERTNVLQMPRNDRPLRVEATGWWSGRVTHIMAIAPVGRRGTRWAAGRPDGDQWLVPGDSALLLFRVDGEEQDIPVVVASLPRTGDVLAVSREPARTRVEIRLTGSSPPPRVFLSLVGAGSIDIRDAPRTRSLLGASRPASQAWEVRHIGTATIQAVAFAASGRVTHESTSMALKGGTTVCVLRPLQ